MANTPQQEGRAFEKRFAKKYGGNEQPGSGNGIYHKLDVKDNKFLWSLKYTSKGSFSFKSQDFKEVNDEVVGQGGLGFEYTPGMAVELDGKVYAILEMDSLEALLQQDVKVYKADKATEKRARAAVPRLLRQADDE